MGLLIIRILHHGEDSTVFVILHSFILLIEVNISRICEDKPKVTLIRHQGILPLRDTVTEHLLSRFSHLISTMVLLRTVLRNLHIVMIDW